MCSPKSKPLTLLSARLRGCIWPSIPMTNQLDTFFFSASTALETTSFSSPAFISLDSSESGWPLHFKSKALYQPNGER